MIVFTSYLWPYYALMALFGLAFGSFANVVICRVPEGGWRSIAAGRSHCDNCSAQLKAYELIPVLSYILLGGKCRTCGARIGVRSPIVELLGAFAFFCAAVRFGFSYLAPVMGIFFLVLLITGFIDADTQYIPDALPIAIAVLAIITYFLTPPLATLANRLIGAACVSIPIYLIARFTGGFGIGDAKLMAAAGLLLGWQLTLTAFLLAVLAGGIAGAILLITKKAHGKTAIAFGPYLCGGLFIAACAGQYVINWYISLLH